MTETAQPPAFLVALKDVSHRYGRLVALREISLSIAPGEFVFVTGPSEAGKTTLLKLIHGDLRPVTGSVLVDGFRLERRWRRFLPRLRRHVAAVFQDHRLLHDMSARANVAFALQVSNLWLPRHAVRGRAQARLDEVGLGKRSGAFPHQLSGGQQRRLAIARALVPGPVLLLADEPTASLDRRNAERVLELLERCCQAGTTVVVATHDVGSVESRGRRVIELHQGRIVADRPAVSPIDSNGAAARLNGHRGPGGPGLRARAGSAVRLALGYTSPPRPAPNPEPRTLSLGARAMRAVQLALGYQPPPARVHVNGAWQAPREVVERLGSNGHANGWPAVTPAVAPVARSPGAGAWRPPASIATLPAARPNAPNGADAAHEKVKGTGNGAVPRNGSGHPLRQLHVLAQVARITRVALGYEPPPTPPREARAYPSAPSRRPWIPVLNVCRLCIGGAAASWARNLGTVAPAVGSIAMMLAVAGGLTVGGFALRTLLVTQSREAAVLHVYLSDNAAGDQIDQTRQALAKLPQVRSVRYIDKDQALQLARQRPELADLAAATDSNPFPASLEVNVDQPADVAAVARVAASEPAVDTGRPTSYDAGTYDRLRQFTLVAAAAAVVLGLLVLAVTYAISSNSIRAALLARRDELLTMQLVGASHWLIRARLAVEGALSGGVAGLAAAGAVVAICAVAYYVARHLFVQLLPGVGLATAAEVVGAVALSGVAIGSISALFAFRRLRT